MSIHGIPRPDPDQPSVSQRSLEKATIRRDMGAVPDAVARKLIKRFHAYVEKVLSRFGTRHLVGVDRADLRSVAQVAIIEAYVLFQNKRGAKLSSWVHRVVRWRVSEAVSIASAGGREQLSEVSSGYLLEAGADGHRKHPDTTQSVVPSLQLQWLRVTLKRHFTLEERALVLGEVPIPKDPQARARMKFRRHKAREQLMQLALEAGVITRSRTDPRAHYIVKLTGDVPLSTG